MGRHGTQTDRRTDRRGANLNTAPYREGSIIMFLYRKCIRLDFLVINQDDKPLLDDHIQTIRIKISKGLDILAKL